MDMKLLVSAPLMLAAVRTATSLVVLLSIFHILRLAMSISCPSNSTVSFLSLEPVAFQSLCALWSSIVTLTDWASSGVI